MTDQEIQEEINLLNKWLDLLEKEYIKNSLDARSRKMKLQTILWNRKHFSVRNIEENQ